MIKERYKSLAEFKTALDQKGLNALDEIYMDFKNEFLKFGKKHNISEEDLKDVYQNSIIAFYENVVNGSLSELTSSIKTYVFSIGKYGIYNKVRKRNKTISLDKEHLENLDLKAVEVENGMDTKSEQIKTAMEKLGDRCKKMLILFYYHSYTIEALMYEFEYKNENVVRSHKSRCLKNLKTIINNH